VLAVPAAHVVQTRSAVVVAGAE
jgi:hypothetical protein